MSSGIVQREFDLRIPDTARLAGMAAARWFLERDEDAILAMIDDGALAYAFDIAQPGARRREVRIWRRSLTCYASGQPQIESLNDVLRDIFGGLHLVTIRATELRKRWTCSSTHVIALVRAGALHTAHWKQGSVGPGSSPEIVRQSAALFLEQRRMQ